MRWPWSAVSKWWQPTKPSESVAKRTKPKRGKRATAQQQRRNNAANSAATKRARIDALSHKRGVYGPASLVAEVARLFPGNPHVNSLRRALARGNMGAAQDARNKLLMATSNVGTTTRLMGAWRVYQELQRQPRVGGEASVNLQNWQRRFGANRRPARTRRKAPGGMNNLENLPASDLNRLPLNVLGLIADHLNVSSTAKLATAMGKRLPDPNNFKELADLVYVSAQLAYGLMVPGYDAWRVATIVLSPQVIERFRAKATTDGEGGEYIILRGRTYSTFVPATVHERGKGFVLRHPRGDVPCNLRWGPMKWALSKGRGVPLPDEARDVVTRALRRAHSDTYPGSLVNVG